MVKERIAGLTALAVGASLALADVQIRSYPENRIWPEGTTQRIWVEADNTQASEPTAGVQWRLEAPEFLISRDYGIPADTSRDFFSGETQWFQYNPIRQTSARINFTPPYPTTTAGDVFFYDVTVSQDAPFGETELSFNPDYTVFSDPTGTYQTPLHMVNNPARAVPSMSNFVINMTGPGLRTADERYNLDQSPDGSCDLGDFAKMQIMYSYPEEE